MAACGSRLRELIRFQLSSDRYRLLKVCRNAAAYDLECPAVCRRLNEPPLGGEHRFDGETHSRREFHRLIQWGLAVFLIDHLIRNMRLHVKLGADAVPAVTMNHRETVPLGNRFNRLSDIVVRLAHLRLPAASFEGFLGALDQLAGGR